MAHVLPRTVGQNTLIFSAVIAVAELYDCVHLSHLPPEMKDHAHAHGPICWLLRNVRAVTPMAIKGRQGLWEFPGLEG